MIASQTVALSSCISIMHVSYAPKLCLDLGAQLLAVCCPFHLAFLFNSLLNSGRASRIPAYCLFPDPLSLAQTDPVDFDRFRDSPATPEAGIKVGHGPTRMVEAGRAEAGRGGASSLPRAAACGTSAPFGQSQDSSNCPGLVSTSFCLTGFCCYGLLLHCFGRLKSPVLNNSDFIRAAWTLPRHWKDERRPWPSHPGPSRCQQRYSESHPCVDPLLVQVCEQHRRAASQQGNLEQLPLQVPGLSHAPPHAGVHLLQPPLHQSPEAGGIPANLLPHSDAQDIGPEPHLLSVRGRRERVFEIPPGLVQPGDRRDRPVLHRTVCGPHDLEDRSNDSEFVPSCSRT